MSYEAKQSTHTTVTLPKSNNAGMTRDDSIRQIMLGGILNGTPRAEIEAQVKTLHPNSAAAAKFGKHLAWYKSYAKKQGLVLVEETAPAPQDLTIEQLEAMLAAKKAEAAAETEAERVERLAAEMAAKIDEELAGQE